MPGDRLHMCLPEAGDTAQKNMLIYFVSPNLIYDFNKKNVCFTQKISLKKKITLQRNDSKHTFLLIRGVSCLEADSLKSLIVLPKIQNQTHGRWLDWTTQML